MTALYEQYVELKRQHPDTILFFRVGDFYEAFGEDAKTVSSELSLTLTSRPMGTGVRIPMAGLPCHSLDAALARLIARGYKVAVAEQVQQTEPAAGRRTWMAEDDAASVEPAPDTAHQLSLPL